MKVLFGVQGTGNGHLSRAMAMAEALKHYPDVEVDWLISGREPGRQYPGIDSYESRQGMTLVTENGRVSVLRTFRKNSLIRLWKEINSFELDGYDLVISDYEPVISHAARRAGIPVTGISHQCAFDFAIPMEGASLPALALMRRFAPVTRPVGLHWHHFGFPILPPIVQLSHMQEATTVEAGKILVYLPMESTARVIEALQPLDHYQFYFYHPDLDDNDTGHIHLRAISTTGFKQDLRSARGIICNSGFELISESLYLGKAIMAKPLYRQMEQQSNACALRELGYATVVNAISSDILADWLDSDPPGRKIIWPDVASRLARWIASGSRESVETLAEELWPGDFHASQSGDRRGLQAG